MDTIDKVLEVQILTLREYAKNVVVPLNYEHPKYYSQGIFYIRGHGFFYQKKNRYYFITSSHVISNDTKIDIDINYLGIPLHPNKEEISTFGNFKVKINNDNQFDVSAIRLDNDFIIENIKISWSILSEENLSFNPFDFKVFIIYGYPFEMCESEGNKLMPGSICLVTTHSMK
jgi:hypothetical protein